MHPPPSSPYQTRAAIPLWVRPLPNRQGLGRPGAANATHAEAVEAQRRAQNRNLVSYALSVTGAGLGAYHGYKRNESVSWAVGWGLLGAMFPIFVVPIAFAQGFGKRKK